MLINIKSKDNNFNLKDIPIEKIKKLEDNIKKLKQDNFKIGALGIAGMVGISALYIITS
jgi:hypothetical protein